MSKTMAFLSVCAGVLLIAFSTNTIYEQRDDKTTSITDCYDKYNHKIIGVQCENSNNSENIGILCFLILIGTLIIFFGYILWE